ncbi:hypothetical protein KKF81_04340 [Candidatus Micrarchaeota archaeon]|nr:hypothetical protein [Candidatus Micrarchaeota archaeon]
MLIFLTLISLVNISVADCVGYGDEFQVRVLDAKYRPIPEASVWITYDRGTSFGDKYFTTPVNYTDSNGMVDYYIRNMGTGTREIDCDIDISASVGGSTRSRTIEANIHGTPIDMVMDDVYPVMFYVRDQHRAAIQNSTVTIDGKTEKTNEYGSVKFFLKKGDHDYLATYLDAKQAGTITVNDDDAYEVLFEPNELEIHVLDDQGNKLHISLFILNQTFDLEDGYFQRDKIFGNSIEYTINYNGVVKGDVIDPASKNNLTIIYDLRSPLLESVDVQTQNNQTTLLITASDPGIYASGVDVSSISVLYKLGTAASDTDWNTATTFSTGHNTFTADLGQLPSNNIMEFKIGIKDREGNSAIITGKFSTLFVPVPQNNTQNQTITQPIEDTGQEIPLIYIIGGVILVILAIYLLIRIKSAAMGGN